MCVGFCSRAWALWYAGFSSCGSLAYLPLGMWYLPGPEIEPEFPCIYRQILNPWTTREVPSQSVAQSCPTLCDPMDCLGEARQASLSITNSWSLLKLMCIKYVMPSSYLIFCRPLLLLLSIFPSIRVFSNESVLRIR